MSSSTGAASPADPAAFEPIDVGTPMSRLPPVHFQLTRRDYVDMSIALARRPLWARALRALLGLAVVFLFGVAGDAAGRNADYLQAFGDVWGDLVGGRTPIPIYAILVAIAALGLFVHRAAGVAALVLYRRVPVADVAHEIRFAEAGLEIVTPLLASTILWPAVTRVIETPRLLLIAISARQAVVVPRRAFDSAETFQAMRAFTLDHVPPKARPRP